MTDPAVAPDPGVAKAKNILRSHVRAERARFPLPDASRAARLARALRCCSGSRVVALYASVPPEPDTLGLADALAAAGVRVLLPKLAGFRTPRWAWYSGPASLVSGWRGIPEPEGPALPAESLAEADLIWCSALAADASGRRVGTGGGWYDRALAHRSRGATVGVLLNDREVRDAVPADAWDVPVHLIVTEQRTIRCPGVEAAATQDPPSGGI